MLGMLAGRNFLSVEFLSFCPRGIAAARSAAIAAAQSENITGVVELARGSVGQSGCRRDQGRVGIENQINSIPRTSPKTHLGDPFSVCSSSLKKHLFTQILSQTVFTVILHLRGPKPTSNIPRHLFLPGVSCFWRVRLFPQTSNAPTSSHPEISGRTVSNEENMDESTCMRRSSRGKESANIHVHFKALIDRKWRRSRIAILPAFSFE